MNQTCLDVILFLANNPEYNTARDLCELRGIRPGNASVAIDTLAGRGLLLRQNDPADRRITRLVLTPEAEKIVRDGRKAQQQFGSQLVQGVTAQELQICTDTILKLQANISDMLS